jgi:hypothetical protein
LEAVFFVWSKSGGEHRRSSDNIIMSSDKTDDTACCASCGKAQSDEIKLKKCACNLVRYCSVACQKDHRSQHKRACKKKVAELFDEKLFAPPPPREDCPICFLPMPERVEQTTYKVCCGKVTCCGCMVAAAHAENNTHAPRCPFCREVTSNSDSKIVKQYRKRMEENNDAIAAHGLAGMYLFGNMGLPQDKQKAIELLTRASELGSLESAVNLGIMYKEGDGVKRDINKYLHYIQMAAMKGNVQARFNLGANEGQQGDNVRATKHFAIAARAGDDEALKMCTAGYRAGLITKDEFEQILRCHKEEKDSMKSEQRDIAMIELASEEHLQIGPR